MQSGNLSSRILVCKNPSHPSLIKKKKKKKKTDTGGGDVHDTLALGLEMIGHLAGVKRVGEHPCQASERMGECGESTRGVKGGGPGDRRRGKKGGEGKRGAGKAGGGCVETGGR